MTTEIQATSATIGWASKGTLRESMLRESMSRESMSPRRLRRLQQK
jgi:hypothetical protein